MGLLILWTLFHHNFDGRWSITQQNLQKLNWSNLGIKILILVLYDWIETDLDDTLYPLSSGLSKGVLKNIQGTVSASKINSHVNYKFNNINWTSVCVCLFTI